MTTENLFRPAYRELTSNEKADLELIKDGAQELLERIQAGYEHRFPETTSTVKSREHALARTALEESVMWAVKGLTG